MGSTTEWYDVAIIVLHIALKYCQDGPALRSTAMITYANWLMSNGNSSYVSNYLWPIIKLDLDYVAQNWNQTTYAYCL